MKKFSPFLVLLVLMIMTAGCNKKDLSKTTDLENTSWILTRSMYVYENGEIKVHAKPWNDSVGFTWHFHREYNTYSNEYVKIVTERKQPYLSEMTAIWETTADSINLGYLTYMPVPIHKFKIFHRTAYSMNLACAPEEAEGPGGRITKVFYTLKRLH